jgi:hypothetical protein
MLKNHPALGGAKAWRSTGLWRGGPATYKVVVVNIDIEANDMRARPGVPSYPLLDYPKAFETPIHIVRYCAVKTSVCDRAKQIAYGSIFPQSD